MSFELKDVLLVPINFVVIASVMMTSKMCDIDNQCNFEKIFSVKDYYLICGFFILLLF